MSQQVAEYNIPKNTGNIIIFVHGFGVRYDSRGMFTEIKDSLPENWGSVLFDFNIVERKNVIVPTLPEQVSRLKNIYRNVNNQYPSAAVHIIAHSQGCVITALSAINNIGTSILLAPPETMGEKIERYFKSQPGVTTMNSQLIVPRKDGSTTFIPVDYFRNHDLEHAEDNIVQYGNLRPLNVVQTTEDEVLGNTQYAKLSTNPSIHITTMASDHNFTGESRATLLSYINEVLAL